MRGAGNLSSLQEQQTTLTAEPSLHPTLLPSLPTFYFIVPRDKIPRKKKKSLKVGLSALDMGSHLVGAHKEGPRLPALENAGGPVPTDDQEDVNVTSTLAL